MIQQSNNLPETISPYAIPGIKLSTSRMIIARVTHETGITYEQMISSSRKREISDARQIAMYIIYLKTNLTHSKIGSIFNRDHSTCIQSTKAVVEKYRFDKQYREKYRNLLSILDSK